MRKKPYNIVDDCVDRQKKRKNHKTALILVTETASGLKSKKYSFATLSKKIERFSKTLNEPKGSRVIVQLPNSLEFIVTFLGAMKAGLIPIPVSPQLTDSELGFIINDSGARIIFSERSHLTLPFQGREDAIGPTVKGGVAAFWLYTSGTTGTPKAVMHAHTSIPAHDARVTYWMDLKKNDILFNTSALNWSYAITSLLDAWRHGVTTVVYVGDLSAEKMIRVIQKQNVTVLMSVPGIYRRLCEKNFKHSLRVSLSAGEKLPEEVRQKFLKQTGLTIREGLGMTEHSVYLVQRKDRKIIPHACGQAVPGSRIAIVKESRRGDKAPFLVPPGQIGILASHRSCRGLMLGYYNRPEEEKKVFRGDWFLSGDLAYKDKQGNFFYVGRRDDMISAGGFRISPLEIEKVLNQCECVLESAVIGREISPGKTIVQAYVVPQGKPQKEKILDHVRESLAVYKRPREIIFLKELPKTRNGKIKRKDL